MADIISNVFIGAAILMIIAFSFFLIYEKIRLSRKTKLREKMIEETIGESYKKYSFGAPSNISFLVSNSGKIAIVPDQLQLQIRWFHFYDITGYSVNINDVSTDGVKEAIVGGLLFGTLDAFNAYHSATSTSNNILKMALYFDSFENGTFTLDFSSYRNSNTFEGKIGAMNELIDVFKYLEGNEVREILNKKAE